MKNNFPSQKQRPILIVDKKGIIGELLASKLSEHFLIVLVSTRPVSSAENIIHVPFTKAIPKIPDNFYSYMFLIDDGEILFKSVPSFIKKANLDQSRVVLIEGIRSANHKSIDEARFYKNANVIFYGDLFSENQILSDIGRDLSKIKANRRIDVGGEGLEKIYPIYVDDFIEVLIEHVFVRNNPQKFINIFPKSPLTKLGIARIIQSIDPEIKMDFVKTEVVEKDPRIENGEYVLGDKYDLRSKFKLILEEELHEDFNTRESLSEEIEETNYLKVAFGFLVLFLIFFLLLPLLTTLAYSGLGLYEIDSLKNNLNKGDLVASYKSAKDAKTFFEFAQKTSIPLRSEAQVLGKMSQFNKLYQKITLGESISQSSLDLISGSQTIEGIIQGKSSNPTEDFNSSLSLMKNSIATFRRIEAQSQEFPEISKKISDISPVVDLVSDVSSFLPQTLGFNKEMKYLILLQNNMELRPGGGFIGSYAILTIRNAIVESFKIYNVYDADGQLKGHVEPPFPIRKYLLQPNLYLRDSNFDLEFSANAAEAAYFLNLETGEAVDGVIALDINFVKDILQGIGPVEVSDYNLKVDSLNLFQITEEKSEKNSFAGSTQKQDFLTALFKSIQSRIGAGKNVPYLSLARAVSSSLKQKHILLASNDPRVQDDLSVNNWSSEIPNASSSASNTFNDFLGISEANLGINKVNYFISRSISKAQKISDSGSLSSTVTITYKNTSKKDAYKNYIRFILPSSASVSQISFDDIAQEIIPEQNIPTIYEAKGYKKPVGLEVDNYSKDGKTIVGFLVQIPPNSTKTVSVTYNLNQIISMGEEFNYNLYFFKQPGTQALYFDLSVYFPQSYNLITKENKSEVSENKVSFVKDLDSDTEFNFGFGQK